MSSRLSICPMAWEGGDVENENRYQIVFVGRSPGGKLISAVIKDYKPWFDFVLPECVAEEDAEIMCGHIYTNLSRNQKYMNIFHEPIGYEISAKYRFHGYSGTRYVLTLYFRTEDACRHIKNLLNKYPVNAGYHYGKVKLCPTERSIEREVDQVKRLHSSLDIKHLSWLEMEGTPNPDPESVILSDAEYIVPWRSIKASPKEAAVSYGPPKMSSLVFDGEMFSYRKLAFPNPLKVKDPVFMWGMIHKYWNGEKFQIDEYCLCYHRQLKREDLGDIKETKLVLQDDGKYKIQQGDRNITVIMYDNEIDLCEGFEDLFIKLDADMVYGHRSNMFDWKYHKVKKGNNGIPYKNLSRKRNHIQGFSNIKWSSSAYKDQNFWIPDGFGRIYYDTCVLLRRDGSKNPDSYALDHVAKLYLGIGKTEWGVQDIRKSFIENNPEYFRDCIIYCMRDVWCTFGLFEHFNMNIAMMQIGNMAGIEIHQTFMRGQGIRSKVQTFRAVQKMGCYVNISNSKYVRNAGGYVKIPKSGVCEYVLLLDFRALYPSIIAAFNLSPDTHDIDKVLSDEDCFIHEWVDDEGKWYARIAKRHVRLGVLPSVVEECGAERNYYKGLEKKYRNEGDKVQEFENFCAQQNCKITANSVYGACSMPHGALTDSVIAALICRFGQLLIKESALWAEANGYNVVYGDTDSIMITKGEKGEGWTKEEIVRLPEIAEELCERMNKELFTSPITLHNQDGSTFEVECLNDKIVMEPDGVMRSAFFTRKKKYSFFQFDSKDPFGFNLKKFKAKGLTPKRRDTCLFVRKSLEQTLIMITMKRAMFDVFSHCCEVADQLLSGQVCHEELITIVKMGSSYTCESNQMAIYKKHLDAQGIGVLAGDRVPFYYVDRPHKKSGETFEYPSVVKDKNLPLLYTKYFESQLMNKIDNLLMLAYPDDLPKPVFCNVVNLFDTIKLMGKTPSVFEIVAAQLV